MQKYALCKIQIDIQQKRNYFLQKIQREHRRDVIKWKETGE